MRAAFSKADGSELQLEVGVEWPLEAPLRSRECCRAV